MVSQHHIRLNRLATQALRRLPWPIRNRFKHFPPIALEASTQEATLLVMGTTDRVPESIWAAYTFLFWHPLPLRLVLAFDGQISSRSATQIQRVLPGAEIIDATATARQFDAFPALGEFCVHNRFGRKLSMVCEINKHSDLIYIDSDVLFFNRAHNIMTRAVDTSKGTMVTIAPGSEYATVGPIVDFAAAQGIEVPKGLNSGFFIAPPRIFDLNWMNDALIAACPELPQGGEGSDLAWSFFTEQNLIGASLVRQTHEVLPVETFVNSNEGMLVSRRDATVYEGIVMRHFFGTVRHRFYMTGLPLAYERMFPPP